MAFNQIKIMIGAAIRLNTLAFASFALLAAALALIPQSATAEEVAPPVPETWVEQQILAGQPADLNEFCKNRPVEDHGELSWDVRCRLLSGIFVQKLLTMSSQEKAADGGIPFAGIHIMHATFVGSISLANADLNNAVMIHDSQFSDKITLTNAKTDKLFSFDGTHFQKGLDAQNFQAGGDLSLVRCVVVGNELDLTGAKIGGILDLKGINLNVPLKAERLSVGGDLRMDKAEEQPGDDLGKGKAEESTATFGEVFLMDAHVAGQVIATGSIFTGELHADSLNVGGSVNLSGSQYRGKIGLRGAKIAGDFDMNSATFSEGIYAGFLQVGQNIFLRNATLQKQLVLPFSRLNGNFFISQTTLAGLDLSSASIAGDFQLGETDNAGDHNVTWLIQSQACETRKDQFLETSLSLRYAYIRNLSDTEKSWPPLCQLYLDGFSFSHVGGYQAWAAKKMNERGWGWWDTSWARLDSDYSPSPYNQLATVLTNEGDRDGANQVRYLGRTRKQENENWFDWTFSGFLRYVAGFGIGSYTFRVLWWVILIALLGAAYLKFGSGTRPSSSRHFAWCFGATVSRLLPGIKINKEFEDFFDDEKQENLTAPQRLVFSLLGIVGFVFGLILVGALTGVLQSS